MNGGMTCSNLVGCLGDDIPLAPELARRAITVALYADAYSGYNGDLCESCVGGRYYPMLTEIVLQGVHETEFWLFAMTAQRMAELAGDFMPDSDAVLSAISAGIRSSEFDDRIMGAALLMTAAYLADRPRGEHCVAFRLSVAGDGVVCECLSTMWRGNW